MGQIIYIGNYLTRHGYTPNFNEFLADRLKSEGWKIICTSNKKNKWIRGLDMMFTILWNRRNTNYLLIDTFSSSAFWFAYLSAGLGTLFGIPYFTLIRGGDMEKRIAQWPSASDKLFRNSRVNISPSRYFEEVFHKNKFPVIYIPNFIDIENCFRRTGVIIRPNILWVRSLHHIYRPLDACKIILKLKEEFPEIKMTLVGPDKDNLYIELKNFIENNNLSGQINWVGRLTKKEWYTLAESHSFFLNTTEVDNHPLSVIEAMGLGLVIISTRSGGLRYLLKDGEDAMMYDASDVDMAANLIRMVLKNPDLGTQLINKSVNNVKEFTWDKVRLKYAMVFGSPN